MTEQYDGEDLTLEEQIRLGANVAQLLDSQAFDVAMARLEEVAIKAWRHSRPSEEQGREKLYLQIQGVDYVRRELAIMVDRGKAATAQLKQRQEKHDGD